LLANRRRAQEIAGSLKGNGKCATLVKVARLQAEAGIGIGAEGPEEIALGFMAETIAATASSRRTSPG
jgi:xanthine/CO dehydrogenase XdhC/CoxF family maturation factor